MLWTLAPLSSFSLGERLDQKLSALLSLPLNATTGYEARGLASALPIFFSALGLAFTLGSLAYLATLL